MVAKKQPLQADKRLNEGYMKIAVNTRFLIKNKLTGLGHFTFEALKPMVKNNPDCEFIFLFDRKFSDEFVFAPNITPVVVHPQARHPLLFYWWFEYSIPWALKNQKVDAFFSPDNFMSLQLNVPTLLVIHDLAFEHYPKDVYWHNQLYYKYFMPKFARKAARIAAVSEATKRDIVQTYGIEADSIDTVYTGLNKDIGRTGDAAQHRQTRQTYAAGCPYFVNIGTIQPRKNLVNLFRAFEAFKETTGSDTKLLLIGGKGWKNAEIYDAWNTNRYQADIQFLGYVDNRQISEILSAALGLTCVSYFEGFGMPVIEAQACGCPVIASDVSSLPEAGGDAAYYIDPFSVSSIAHAMEVFLYDDSLRNDLINKGLEHHKKFTWDKTAQAIWGSIQKII